MARYAAGTTVEVGKSKAELDALLAKHGAAQRLVATDDATGRVVVQFALAGRMIRLGLSPERCSLNPTIGWQEGRPNGWLSWSQDRRRLWIRAQDEQAEREAWRRLLLVVKGKLELVADKLATVEGEFMSNILLPDGQTLGEALLPQLDESYRTGGMPKLLGSGSP